MEKHDPFCWYCHIACVTTKCTACRRSFHQKCLKEGAGQEGWVCPVCIELRAPKNADSEMLKLLPSMIDRFCKDDSFVALKRLFEFGHLSVDIVNPINLFKIQEKSGSYTSYDALINDAQWLKHNCWILFLESAGQDLYQKSQTAENFIALIKSEINSMKLYSPCYECYSNTKYVNWFEMVCSKPHCIVWAKVTGHPYWPAKVLSANVDMVNVRFFGDHDRACVSVHKCYLYSIDCPDIARRLSISGRPNGNVFNELQNAITETNSYIENLKKKFGGYEMAGPKTPFNPAHLDEYVTQIMHGKSGPRNNSISKFTSTPIAPNGDSLRANKRRRKKTSPQQQNAATIIDEIDLANSTVDTSIADASDETIRWADRDDAVISMANSFEGLKNVFNQKVERASKLERKLKEAQAKHRNEVKVLNERIEKLLKLKQTREIELEQADARHKLEVESLNVNINKFKKNAEEYQNRLNKKDEELSKAIALVELAKFKMYCNSCGKENAQKISYYCNDDCETNSKQMKPN